MGMIEKNRVADGLSMGGLVLRPTGLQTGQYRRIGHLSITENGPEFTFVQNFKKQSVQLPAQCYEESHETGIYTISIV